MRRTLAGLLCAAALSAACADPEHTDAVDALGPEAPGVAPGPLHRPGQPCLTCHGGKGPGHVEFSIAGTLYKYADTAEPLANAIVRLQDHSGLRTFTGTNCAGNFFVQKTDFALAFPVWTRIEFGGSTLDMSTPIFAEGSCAHCHFDPPGESSVGRVYFAPVGLPLPGGDCP